MSEQSGSGGTGTTRDDRIERAFEAAMAAPEPERAAVLDRMCAGDSEARAEVESLLRHAQRTREFLESPLMPGVAGLAMPLPETIGAFRVVGLLGEGGMGCVYEAQQERPLRRVAIKMVRGDVISPGALRRFDREIQTLGQLRHPCIAQLYEVGQHTGPGGRALPYLVMELVRGVSLTRVVREEKLSVPERVELLARIADAVQYAHQRGVVHRDLKPENILIEKTEGQERAWAPKILDFGIARLMDAGGEGQTVAGQPMGTLAYMSPEQFAADPAGIDTRCDVYALGVIAYEVFAGARPLDVTGLSVVQAARLIETTEAPKLGTADRALRGDIETIVAKAMAKDRESRYASASAMAEDLRRHLRDEPILARPPSAGYQITKFARRNRGLVGALGLGVAALLAGVVVSTAMYVREQRERKRAADAAALSDGVRDYMISGLLLAAAPERMGHDVKMMDVLTTASQGLHERFEDHPEVESAVRFDLGTVLGQLGRYKESAEEFRRAIPLLEKTRGPDDEKTISALTSLANAQMGMGKPEESLATAQDALERARRGLAEDHPRAISARNNVGAALHALGRADEAVQVLARGLELAERSPVENKDVIGALMSQLAAAERVRGDREAALGWNRRATEHAKKMYGTRSTITVMSRNNMVNALVGAEKYAEAADEAKGLVEDAEAVFAPGHPNRSYVYTTSSNAMWHAGRFEEAEGTALRGYETIVKAQGDWSWAAAESADAVRRLYRPWAGHYDQLKEWSVRSLRARMMRTERSELKTTLDLLVSYTAQCQRAGANMSHGGLLGAMWEEREKLAPPGHPRRARFFAMYALLCDVVEGCEHARDALGLAEEAIRTETDGAAETQAMIALARKRVIEGVH